MKDRKGLKRCPRCNFKRKLRPHSCGTSLCRDCAERVERLAKEQRWRVERETKEQR